MYTLVGLGNPGQEYEKTPHNIGREFVFDFCQENKLEDFEFDKKSNSLLTRGSFGKTKFTVLLPETFMNNSGKAVSRYVKSKKAAEKMIVVHDEIDLPLGRMKISFNRSPGGHRGVESVRRSVGTDAFVRVRIGISPSTAGGKLKKPSGEKAVHDLILSKFSKKQEEVLEKVQKDFNKIMESILSDGHEAAMNEWNGRV